MTDFSKHDDEEMYAYVERVSKERRFSTQEEFQEFCSSNFVFFGDDMGMRLQQLIETKEQFVAYLSRVCMSKHGDGWISWLESDALPQGDYVRPSKHLMQRRKRVLEATGEDAHTWLVDGEGLEYSPDLEIQGWVAEYNQFYDKPFSVHPETIRVFQEGDLEVPDNVLAKMPFIARFVSHNTFDRCGSIEGNDLEIIPLGSLASDVISIY